MDNSYEEYAVLSAKIKDLTNKRDELKVVIIQDLAEQELSHG